MEAHRREARPFFESLPEKPRYLIRDRDTKFVAQFDAALEAQGIEIKRTAPRCPTQNSIAERYVGTAKRECLDNLVIFGEGQLRYVLGEMAHHYNELRPHQGLQNGLLSGVDAAPADVRSAKNVVCEKRLGGLLCHYHHPTSAAA